MADVSQVADRNLSVRDEAALGPEPVPALSIVIPAHDEADNLPGLLAEIAAAMAEHGGYEVVVVDDASGDGTWEVLQASAAAHSWLHPIRHLTRTGQSAAILSGVQAARAAWIATMDGDGQNDPRDLGTLLSARERAGGAGEALLIAGERRRRHDRWVRRASSVIANSVRSRLLGDATADTGCGLKLFRRDAFLALPRFDHSHRFLPALFLREGGRVVSIAVGHRPRTKGQSHYKVKNRLWVGIVDLLGVMWLKRRGVHAQVFDPWLPEQRAQGQPTLGQDPTHAESAPE